MATATKERESKALTTKKRTEVLPRTGEFERWFDRFFEDFMRRPFPRFPSLLPSDRWWPFEPAHVRIPIDVYEEQDHVVAKAELPGLAKEEIKVQVTDDALTFSGEKKREEDIEETDYACRERTFGSFSRTVELPCEVQADQVKASFANGVLEVRLPKTEEAKKRKAITVKID